MSKIDGKILHAFICTLQTATYGICARINTNWSLCDGQRCNDAFQTGSPTIKGIYAW